MLNETINLSVRSIDDSTINRRAHIEASLGKPESLPEWLDCEVSDNGIDADYSLKAAILDYCYLVTGKRHREADTFNSYNSDNSLSGDLIFTLFVPVDCGDEFWCPCFVLLDSSLYRIEDNLADSSFLEWTIGYWLSPLQPDSLRHVGWERELEPLNNRVCCGYSSYPYGELEDYLESAPIYSERHGCYVARPICPDTGKRLAYVCRVDCEGPSYGG